MTDRASVIAGLRSTSLKAGPVFDLKPYNNDELPLKSTK